VNAEDGSICAVINTGKEADTHTIEIKIGEIRLRVVIGADVGNCAVLLRKF